jgi:hypothetical protein
VEGTLVIGWSSVICEGAAKEGNAATERERERERERETEVREE